MFPISQQQLNDVMAAMGISNISHATIRQICSLSEQLSKIAGEEFVHLEIGNPGLEANATGVEAECRSLIEGVANKYPDISGIPPLKEAGARFVKAFLDVDLGNGSTIVPTVGSMQGTYAVMSLLQQTYKGERDTILFINPGFPAQKSQAHLLGLKQRSFDIYNFRGQALRDKLRESLEDGKVAAILYCNPNNPAWINLTEEELQILGEEANARDVIILEDLAYMGMDFRVYAGKPYQPPFVPTVARYTDNYILFISASKIFSYAGQRIAMVCFSPSLYSRKFETLKDFFGISRFGDSFVFGIIYALSSGAAHSAQRAFAAMLDAAADGRIDFVSESLEYGRRAALTKKILKDNGFHIIYDRDADNRYIADGFFFTAGYGNLTSSELQSELLRHGVSAISLPSTGSQQEGLRICVSMISDDETFRDLDKRLKNFHDEQQRKN